MKELAEDLRRRSAACEELIEKSNDLWEKQRLQGKADAYRHAADLALAAAAVQEQAELAAAIRASKE